MTNPKDYAFTNAYKGNSFLIVEKGLTKREYFAIHSSLAADEYDFTDLEPIEELLGRTIEFSDLGGVGGIKIAAEIEAAVRVIKADALIAALNK